MCLVLVVGLARMMHGFEMRLSRTMHVLDVISSRAVQAFEVKLMSFYTGLKRDCQLSCIILKW